MGLTVNNTPTTATIGQPTEGAYWIGSDGRVYVAGKNGVNAAGTANAQTNQYWQSRGYNLINDPNPGGAATGGGGTSYAPSNPTGASTPAAPVLDAAAVANTQASIDQLPGILQAALANEDTQFGNTNSAFDAQETGQRGTYDTSTTTNQQNYDANFMDAIRAGIKGLHGLYQILRGSGASGGTAEDQVRSVVGDTTAGDIRTGADTRNNNQSQLDSALSQFLTELSGKRVAAKDTHENNAAALRRDSNTNLQDLYGKMAGFYGAAGDTGNASSWMSRAGSLTPAIAADSKGVTSKYDTTPVVIHAPNLTAFAAPSQPAVAAPVTDGEVGSGIFTLNPSKKADQTQVPALAGA